jgi:hypothetical protein
MDGWMYLLVEGVGDSAMLGDILLLDVQSEKEKFWQLVGLVGWNAIPAWLQKYGPEVLCRLQRRG